LAGDGLVACRVLCDWKAVAGVEAQCGDMQVCAVYTLCMRALPEGIPEYNKILCNLLFQPILTDPHNPLLHLDLTSPVQLQHDLQRRLPPLPADPLLPQTLITNPAHLRLPHQLPVSGHRPVQRGGVLPAAAEYLLALRSRLRNGRLLRSSQQGEDIRHSAVDVAGHLGCAGL
jgi:hypothetical protein